MPDQLRDLSDQRDRANASRSRLEPDRLILPPRPGSFTRRICIACRRVADDSHHRMMWRLSIQSLPPGVTRSPYDPPAECPDCRGRLVEMTG